MRWIGERGQRRAGDAADAPVGHDGRAHALVEADRAFVPVEDAPFEAAATARRGEAGEVLEQGLANALAALGRLDEEVLEIEARAREEGREVGEEERERDDAAGALGDDGLDDRLGAEQMERELLGRDLEQMG